MTMAFHEFPNRKSAESFARKVQENYGLESRVSNSLDPNWWERLKGIPFKAAPVNPNRPIFVTVERADEDLRNVKDKKAVKAAAKKFIQKQGKQFACIANQHVIEEAVEDLAKSFGGGFHST